jgi:hypothetical protein
VEEIPAKVDLTGPEMIDYVQYCTYIAGAGDKLRRPLGERPVCPSFPSFRNCGCPVLAFFARAGALLPTQFFVSST